jgi:hypothetical protein
MQVAVVDSLTVQNLDYTHPRYPSRDEPLSAMLPRK